MRSAFFSYFSHSSTLHFDEGATPRPLPVKSSVNSTYGPKFVISSSRTSVSLKNYRNSIFQRAYYEYLHCVEQHGVCYFLTFTYDDAHLPTFVPHGDLLLGDPSTSFSFGLPCIDSFDRSPFIDFDDFRYFLNSSGFSKALLRNFGFRFTYLCIPEFGEGKGKRGLDNNPHYHILFYLYPVDSSVSITDECFLNLCSKYWRNGFVSYSKKAGPRVTSFKACKYCSKYITKYSSSAPLLARFYDHAFVFLFRSVFVSCPELMDYMYDFFVRSSESRLVSMFPSALALKCSFSHYLYALGVLYHDFPCLFDLFFSECLSRFGSYFNAARSEYLRRFKVRAAMSHHFGDYGVKFVDKTHNTISVPYKNGFKSFPICGYYYRKLYYKSVRSVLLSNNVYIYNDACVSRLVSSYPSASRSITTSFDYFVNNIPSSFLDFFDLNCRNSFLCRHSLFSSSYLDCFDLDSSLFSHYYICYFNRFSLISSSLPSSSFVDDYAFVLKSYVADLSLSHSFGLLPRSSSTSSSSSSDIRLSSILYSWSVLFFFYRLWLKSAECPASASSIEFNTRVRSYFSYITPASYSVVK
ncbi:replication initiator protein [Dipodfec virus UOA04_Rod_567]|nr:replication initiator protein [Dipodfec virus UOA04_Rod_567]